MLIDTHVHLDFREFSDETDKIIRRAFDNGVEKIINIGCNLERSKKSIKIAERYNNVFAAVGIHPTDTKREVEKYSREKLVGELGKLAKHPKVVAIGEIGLDYYRIDSDEKTIKDKDDEEAERIKDIQKEVFQDMLKLAIDSKKPIVIHCRDAYSDLLSILENKDYELSIKNYSGVTHCFGGSRRHAKRFLNLGFYFSFTGAITYIKNPEAEVFKVIKELPLNRILIETDSPYLAPEPFRGGRNEPAYVKYVAEKIAEVKGVSFEEVAEAATRNAIELFKLRSDI